MKKITRENIEKTICSVLLIAIASVSIMLGMELYKIEVVRAKNTHQENVVDIKEEQGIETEISDSNEDDSLVSVQPSQKEDENSVAESTSNIQEEDKEIKQEVIKPAETKPVEQKPITQKPGEIKPEDKPKEEAKPTNPELTKGQPADPKKPYELIFHENYGTTDKCMAIEESENFKNTHWLSTFCDDKGNLFYDLENPNDIQEVRLAYPGYDAKLTLIEIREQKGELTESMVYKIASSRSEANDILAQFPIKYEEENGKKYDEIFNEGRVEVTSTNDGIQMWVVIFTHK